MQAGNFLYIVSLLVCLAAVSCKSGFDGKNGIQELYDPETKKLIQKIEYKEGKMNGWCEEFYPNGKLRSRGYYVNDEVKDTILYYHKNGLLSSIQVYKDGKKEGCWKKYSEKGVLWSEVWYKNHSLHGPSNRYTYETGRPFEKLLYNNGYKEGWQIYYHNNGRMKSKAYFTTANKCTQLREWYESGKEVDLDFKITFREKSSLALNQELTLIVELEDPQPDDRVFEIVEGEPDSLLTPISYFRKSGDHFEKKYYVGQGGFVMMKIKIAAYRKTNQGNEKVKTATYNLAVNNL